MAEQEKKTPDVENLEVKELEGEDLEDVSGGATSNSGCPTTNIGCS